MADTHGAQGEPWYGFDLDGTLAEYDGWKGEQHIGAPIPPMVKLIRRLHKLGRRVKIVTARVAPGLRHNFSCPNPYWTENWTVQDPEVQTWALLGMWGPREFIQEWCYRNLGFVPEITHEKDPLMLWLVDDRVVQVEPNTGKVLGRLPKEIRG